MQFIEHTSSGSDERNCSKLHMQFVELRPVLITAAFSSILHMQFIELDYDLIPRMGRSILHMQFIEIKIGVVT